MSVQGKLLHPLQYFAYSIRMSHIWSRCIKYEQFGDPREVLSLTKVEVKSELAPKEVLVKWYASPVNPLDINKIEGGYVHKPSLPAIGGSEGAGVVEKIGNNVYELKPGDAVISSNLNVPYWTEYNVQDSSQLIKIDKRIDLISAATFSINPPTAYIMLKEYVDLNPGDFIIQNSANSGVGRYVIQLARAFGLKSINLIRDRPNVQELKNELNQLGADYVFTEDVFKSEGRKLMSSLNKPIRLAMNGVGGRSSLYISSALEYGGTLVTYGGMSRKAHEISTGSFVFKNLRAFGCAVGPWVQQPENKEKVKKMFDHLEKLCLDGTLKPTPVKDHDLENFSEAINNTVEGKHGKQLLLLHPDAKIKHHL
uniref:Enoyl-[acyl-carrier-protein] reductase, mitochondrial n=1 Tax=Acrobeloides nanus TaxID=290746 RepID=A0A914C7Y3_9BILA